MRERLVEDWLTKANERAYEIPFAQVLALEGHKILQGPTHHAFEHGKDIITLHNGLLCAFQLKSGDAKTLKVADFDKLHGQLFALATTATNNPSLSAPRVPDQKFFVCNRIPTPPFVNRMEQFNLGLREKGYSPVEIVGPDQLLRRFLACHGKFFPEAPEDLGEFLKIFLSDGTNFFPSRAATNFVEKILPFRRNVTKRNCERALASSALLFSYLTSPWERTGNSAAVAQAWLVYACQVLRMVSFHNLRPVYWETSFDLSMQAARTYLRLLLEEALRSRDFVIPDIAEPFVYSARSLHLCGYLAAYYLSESVLGRGEALREGVREVLVRELPYLQIIGESTAPHWFLVSLALSELGLIKESEQMILAWVGSIAKANQPGSLTAVADPYHPTEDLLLRMVDQLEGKTGGFSDEDFSGSSYTLRLGVEWLARRLYRRNLAYLWADFTRILLCEFQPSADHAFFRVKDEAGKLRKSFFKAPTSWATLQMEARADRLERMPKTLFTKPELLPFFCLLLPHRFTSAVAKALDELL